MNISDKNYHLTRRDALHRLAKLPYITLGLSLPGRVLPPTRYGDAVTHCTAALESCWELYWSNERVDIVLAFQCVSTYLPLLKTIAIDSPVYREQASILALQYAILKALLGWNCSTMAQTVTFAKDAVSLSYQVEDIPLQLAAYRTLARAYFDDKKYIRAWSTLKEAEKASKEHQKNLTQSHTTSNILGWFYSTYALVQTRIGQSPDYALDIAQEHVLSPGTASPLKVFPSSTQVKEAALICCSYGDQSQAMTWLEKRIDPDTLLPRIPQTEWGRIETINIMVQSMLKSKERDMEKIVHHWTVAIKGARTLRHEQGFHQAVAHFESMELVFPDENKIQELRPLTVHWDMGQLT